ncbi:MAG TPA: FAD-binding oxidoreductase [Burkholderiaceae bacterium]|nr:FAD-binding oxidoreductase [Burkholderiaceae bacterium]
MNFLPAQKSLWEATAVAAPDAPPLRGPRDADVVVVGGGYAGLSCALHLAERGVAVTVLEAAHVGAGASGRNGGQVLFGGKQSRSELVARYGEATGHRLHAFGAGAADATFAIIKRLGLQCDAVQAGSIYAADSPAGLAETCSKHQALMAMGVDARALDRDQLREATGSHAYLGGYFNPRGGSVQPLSLVRELARATLGAGAQVHEGSPALSIARDGADWRVHTAHGSVRARRVLLATNGRPGGLWSRLNQAVLPVWSFQVATDPLPPSAGVLAGGAVVSDTRRVLRYFRRDREGRLVLGGKGTIRAPRGPQSFALQRKTLARLYPQLADQALSFYWGGQVSVTLDRLPRLFVLDEGVLATVACNGKGVAWNVALGPVLADAMSGAPLGSLPLPPARPLQAIPLHSLKQIYTAVGGTWLRLCDSLDRSRPHFS